GDTLPVARPRRRPGRDTAGPHDAADLVAAPPQGRERVGHRRPGDGEDDGSRGRVHPALLQPGPLPRRERQGAAAADSAGEDEGPGEVEPGGREGGSKKRKKDDMMAPRNSFGGGGGMPMGMGGMNMGGNQMGMGGMGMGGMSMTFASQWSTAVTLQVIMFQFVGDDEIYDCFYLAIACASRGARSHTSHCRHTLGPFVGLALTAMKRCGRELAEGDDHTAPRRKS
ncbi:hypothetical protein THAOC_30380, partial [Thalassiosira oceanica]